MRQVTPVNRKYRRTDISAAVIATLRSSGVQAEESLSCFTEEAANWKRYAIELQAGSLASECTSPSMIIIAFSFISVTSSSCTFYFSSPTRVLEFATNVWMPRSHSLHYILALAFFELPTRVRYSRLLRKCNYWVQLYYLKFLKVLAEIYDSWTRQYYNFLYYYTSREE